MILTHRKMYEADPGNERGREQGRGVCGGCRVPRGLLQPPVRHPSLHLLLLGSAKLSYLVTKNLIGANTVLHLGDDTPLCV